MKKTILITLALGLAGATSLTAGTVEVFLTGSTAFRANAYTAATKLFQGTPSIYYGDAAHGGAASGFGASTAAWAMSGTPITNLASIQGNTLIVHGLFTGSIQGIQTVEQHQKLTFPAASGALNGLCDAYVTNSPTIGFSDASSAVTPYPAGLFSCSEDAVAVLPFVFAKSAANVAALNSITNISREQANYAIPRGRIPLSTWTGNTADTNTFIYMVQRTLDSGTRRAETACAGYAYGDTVGTYIWNETGNYWYPGTNDTVIASSGNGTNGIVGPAGLNNANVTWGAGYVGGGDVRDHALKYADVNNLSIGFISFSDTKSTAIAGANWATVVSFNGVWPTTLGANIHGNTGTNDFAPIALGYYPLWSELVMVYPTDIDNFGSGDNKISTSQLGSENDPGTFAYVFNFQTKDHPGSPLQVGSIENEIELSKTSTGGATAIRLSEMRCNRPTVGGTINPF